MLSKVVTNKAGLNKTVYAEDEKALDEIANVVENQVAPVYPDINIPVQKGHDLLGVSKEGLVLVDGTGAHNSPRDAVRDDGSVEGDPKVPVVVSAATTTDPAQKLAGADQKTADLTDKDKQNLNPSVAGGSDVTVPTDATNNAQ